MSEEMQSLALLISAVGALSAVIVHLYNRVNKLNDKITNLQEQFRTEIVSVHEKTLAMIPSIEKTVLDSNINMTDKVNSKIEGKHKETQALIKEVISKNNN